jgi:amidophosphoribosyltransferase
VYRNPAPTGWSKLTLHSEDPEQRWQAFAQDLSRTFGCRVDITVHSSHACVVVDTDPGAVETWVRERHGAITITSVGELIEIYKEVGRPESFVERFHLVELQGTHALGHTRMATESRVMTAASHPFSTGVDLCLVHNGSLSNHNRVREQLRRRGLEFQTDNDTEVAAGYLASRLQDGATLEEGLEGCLSELDGFYTFAVGTVDGFAVLRDPIACKPAVIAETDEWVAMGSEYRAISVLPGASEASVWEPEPGVVYAWQRTAAR